MLRMSSSMIRIRLRSSECLLCGRIGNAGPPLRLTGCAHRARSFKTAASFSVRRAFDERVGADCQRGAPVGAGDDMDRIPLFRDRGGEARSTKPSISDRPRRASRRRSHLRTSPRFPIPERDAFEPASAPVGRIDRERRIVPRRSTERRTVNSSRSSGKHSCSIRPFGVGCRQRCSAAICRERLHGPYRGEVILSRTGGTWRPHQAGSILAAIDRPSPSAYLRLVVPSACGTLENQLAVLRDAMPV